MNKYDDLAKWLQNDIWKPLCIPGKNDTKTFVRVPYGEDFDFIYYQDRYNSIPMDRHEPFRYCGFYNKLDGLLYDAIGPLKYQDIEIDSEKSFSDLQRELDSNVRRFIENIVGEDVDNLRSPFFEDARFDSRLDDFRRNFCKVGGSGLSADVGACAYDGTLETVAKFLADAFLGNAQAYASVFGNETGCHVDGSVENEGEGSL